jgi:hypothetical protein
MMNFRTNKRVRELDGNYKKKKKKKKGCSDALGGKQIGMEVRTLGF